MRLFVNKRPGDKFYRKQENLHRKFSIADSNAALNDLKPYPSTPDAGKEFYGAKLCGNSTQYGLYVPPQHVPNEYDLLEGGQAQGLLPRSQRLQRSLTDYVVPGMKSASAVTDSVSGMASGSLPPAKSADTIFNSHRWSAKRDEPLLMNIINLNFGGELPQSAE